MRASARRGAEHARVAHRTFLQDLSGAPPDNQAGPHVRAPTVGTQRPGDVAGAPDSVRWRTGPKRFTHLRQMAKEQLAHLNTIDTEKKFRILTDNDKQLE